MEIIEIIAQESGERIDALLARSEDSLTRSAAQKLLDAGKVCVNGKAVRKNYKCQSGDTVRFSLPEPEETELVAQDIPLDVVFEDNDVIVINKPRGMVVLSALAVSREFQGLQLFGALFKLGFFLILCYISFCRIGHYFGHHIPCSNVLPVPGISHDLNTFFLLNHSIVKTDLRKRIIFCIQIIIIRKINETMCLI